jgi:hypothetical protein
MKKNTRVDELLKKLKRNAKVQSSLTNVLYELNCEFNETLDELIKELDIERRMIG